MGDFKESVCLNCGKTYFTRFKHRSCDTCYYNYRNGKTYSECLKCGKAKTKDHRGLCEKCYFEAKDKAYALNRDWFL